MTRIGIIYDPACNVPERLDGTCSEFEMMPEHSVKVLSEALKELGINNIEVLSTKETLAALDEGDLPIDFAFNLSSGIVEKWRYAQAPMGLDILGVPYSGADMFSILLCRDKQRTKQLCSNIVKVPRGIVLKNGSPRFNFDQSLFPCIMKPNQEGGSAGVFEQLLYNSREVWEQFETMQDSYPEGVLVEEMIFGTELTSVIVGNGVNRTVVNLALTNRDRSPLKSSFIRTQTEKAEAFSTGDRTWFKVLDILPCSNDYLTQTSIEIVNSLEVRDLARIDYRIDAEGEVYLIEVNAQPAFVEGNTALYRANELEFEDGLGLEKLFIQEALTRVNL